MKKLLFILLVLTGCKEATKTAAESDPKLSPTPNPAADLCPSNTVLNLRGDDLNSTSNSGVSIVSGAFDFPNNAYFSLNNLGNDYAIGNSDFTVDFWLYPREVDSDDGLFQMGPDQADAYNFSAFLWSGVLHVVLGGTNNTNSARLTTPAPAENAWTFLTITRSGPNLSVYYSGVLQKTIVLTNSLPIIKKDLFVGTYWSNYRLDGLIDDFRFIKSLSHVAASSCP